MTLPGTFGYKPPQPYAPPILKDAEARMALWTPYYHNRQTQLGATATIVNFGDTSNFGLTTAATGTGKKFSATGLSPTWTPSEALSAFDTGFDLSQAANWQGIAPVITLNGSDEEMDTPDATYWSRGDGANDSAFSLGIWVNVVTSALDYLMSKWDGVAAEWLWEINASGILTLYISDQSAGVNCKRATDATVGAAGTWLFLVSTYSGVGGASAANGMVTYVNGASVASTATNNAAYVAMENGTHVVELFFNNGSGYLSAKVAGGPFGPFFVQAQLTAEQVANLYEVERLALGV